MEAVSTSETLFYLYKITLRNIPEGYHFQILIKCVAGGTKLIMFEV
jgi:hypothetical protein